VTVVRHGNRTQALGRVLAAFGVFLLTADMVLLGLNTARVDTGRVALNAILGVAILAYTGAGRLITSRRPGNAVGWLLGLIGVTIATSTFAEQYALYGLATARGSVPGARSVGAAAALFTPLRSRVQHLVDRRFNRTRYDADQTLTAFAARLKDAVDQDAVRADLLGVVHRSLEPTHAAVWVRPVR
jgi:hypothetical protein